LAVSVDHWKQFAEFCHYEQLAGGPDPHMALVGEMSRGEPLEEIWWRAGCYIACYNAPTAEAIWKHWTAREVRANPEGFRRWIRENWAGLGFRRERRAVRTPEKLGRFFISYVGYMPLLKTHFHPEANTLGPYDAYEMAWREVQKVYGLGRYVALKILEFLQRYAQAPIALPDIRARGGWSPRRALALLYPDDAEALEGDDSPGNIALAEERALKVREWIRYLGIPLSMYNLQVLLCDYKQSAVGRRQYPGRSQDSEIVYARKVESHFTDIKLDMWEARKRLFPHWALGELNGWEEVREPLGDVLADHGYTWSDSLYDWHASKDNLAEPVLK
jgi:hypothetical protein